MKSAYIFGNGGHARVVASLIHKKYDCLFFVSPEAEGENSISETLFFLELEKYKDSDIFIGIGSNKIRKLIFEKLIANYIVPATCIADHAFVAHNAKIGRGVVVCPGAVIGANATIGDNTIVNTLSSVDHDCSLGNHSQVTVGVTFGGTTIVGENCFFGAKSATIPNIKIGDNSIISAGSVLFQDVPENVMVRGNPATIVKNLAG